MPDFDVLDAREPYAYELVGPRTLERRSYEEPALGPHDVRLKSILSGISHGTEMNLYRGSSPFAHKHFDTKYRYMVPNETAEHPHGKLGYELISRVVEVGDEVSSVQVGDLVHTATPHQPTTVINLEQDARTEIPMLRLPPGVTPEEGVFSALIGVALAGVQDAQVKVGDQVMISGLGTIGLILVQLARLNGALRIMAVDPIARRREMALALGADIVVDPTVTDPVEVAKVNNDQAGPDVVIESSGNYQALQNALRCAHMAGTVVTLGYYQGGATPLLLGEEWHHNRLTLISSMGVWGCPSRFAPMWDRRRVSRTALELLARKLVRVDSLITQRFAYANAPQAYELIDQNPEETIKVVLEY